MTWALAALDGVVPDAASYAWDEFVRNTLRAHADAFPDHWDGVISVDDVCAAYYAPAPESCGIGLTSDYNTQILHQPADRKSTRLNSSHVSISYAVFCLKKKK